MKIFYQTNRGQYAARLNYTKGREVLVEGLTLEELLFFLKETGDVKVATSGVSKDDEYRIRLALQGGNVAFDNDPEKEEDEYLRRQFWGRDADGRR